MNQMNTKSFLIVIAFIVTGCTVTRFENKDGVKLVRYSFLQAPEIGEVSLTTNAATMKGYKGQELAPIVEAAVGAAIKASAP